jgi:hypothetical protein
VKRRVRRERDKETRREEETLEQELKTVREKEIKDWKKEVEERKMAS